MAKSWKTPLFNALIIFLTAGWVLQACSPAQSVSISLISTPAQDKYAEAFIQYVRQLEKEGLTTVKEIRVEESQPFIFILKPQSKEITDEDVVNATELALRTVSVFDSGGCLKHDDIDVAFRRPMEQQVLLIKRRNMLELLSADIYGEVTIPLIKPISGALSIGLTREKWKLRICECMVCYQSNLSCLRRKFSG